MINIKNNQRGFTMVETMFVLAIFTVLIGAITLFARNLWYYGSFTEVGLSDTTTGKKAIKTMIYEVREASTADTGAYVITAATSNSFTFYSDIDHDNLKERVRYFLNGTELDKGVVKPTGSPLSYNLATETITPLLQNVTSASIFDYYDKNYDGTTAALVMPVNIPDIRLIKITLTIDKDPNRPPAPSTFSTQISIRSIKDNL